MRKSFRIGLTASGKIMEGLRRRDFLRMLGLGPTVLAGCSSESGRKLLPYIRPPDDLIPGEAAWYATTCRECPAGCGMLAKNRDGRIIKVEGNPAHPVSHGKLCPRGQASVQGLYSPDRFGGPLFRTGPGQFESISWNSAEELLIERLRQVRRKGRKDSVILVSHLITGTLKELATLWLSELGQPRGLVLYEAFAYEALRKANEAVFGLSGIPSYRIDQADFLISFGAGFLETWLSNVEYTYQFSEFHKPRDREKNFFLWVGSRLSMTGANADEWLAVAPGKEYIVAIGILKAIDEGGLVKNGAYPREKIRSIARGFSWDGILQQTGVGKGTLVRIAQVFAASKRPLALAEGLPCSNPKALETAIGANFLCTLVPESRRLIDFGSRSSLETVARAAEMKELTERMRSGDIDLLLLQVHDSNPAYSLPSSWNFSQALEKVPFIVSFSSGTDETSRLAHLVLPTTTFLESWGDYSPRGGVTGILQPGMRSLFDVRHMGDILLSSGRAIRGRSPFPWKNFYEFLRSSWERRMGEEKAAESFEPYWTGVLKRGGAWEKRRRPQRQALKSSMLPFAGPEEEPRSKPDLDLTLYPTVRFYDGRMANRPFIQELPDPMSQVTWGGWVEIHPETARRLGIRKNDVLRLNSPYGSIEVPALPLATVPPDVLAVPIGQGHTAYGRFAGGLPSNPFQLLSPDIDPRTGGILWRSSKVTLTKLDKVQPLAHTDGSRVQHDRGIAQSLSREEYERLKSAGHKAEILLPLPEGVNPKSDFYPPHGHGDYRWAMIVDLDRCIGCGACVVACYAENNVPVVGREQVLKNREMSWLHIERYFEKGNPGIRFLPMLCQHCDFAPCESVCPVFAPHHNPDGINNQVYNRCIGTRDCSQNCPYKVRRFNWFTFSRAWPLNWQLNPDVTVRQKGVMEKCSFCIQRIVGARVKARTDGRKIRDGEFTTACAQTCPANVYTFGNLKDPESRVSKLIQDPRAYQVLHHLNTKPAVIYLKKITQELETI
jgi:molybdopterin-containing oxidoreductase family iron-sulfur binding subunit